MNTHTDERPIEQYLEDIRERDNEISHLKSEIEILRNIISMIPGNIFWKDKEGQFLGCNNNVARIFGFKSPNEIIGKRNSDLFDDKLALLVDQVDSNIDQLGKEVYLEEKGLNVHQQPAIYLTRKIPLHDDAGDKIGILGVSFDITERKKMEEDLKIAKEKAEASNVAKSQFLAVINHELRTPLTGIVGLIDFLKKGNLSVDEEKNIIEGVENCTQHLLNLVNDIIEFSRLEADQYTARAKVMDLDDALNEVYGILKTLAKNKGLELCIHSMPKVPHHIVTDSRVLRQILINLISNAIKFTDKGHITVQIRNLRQIDKKALLEISVIDTGLGIPANKISSIFEPFQQLEDAYTRHSSRSGTGLGLTIVDKLATLIGAKISVISEPGKGSAFSLIGEFETCDDEIPLKEKKKKLKIKAPTTTYQTQIITKKPNVLLIEDDPIVQYVHAKMLTDLGCDVDAVSNGYEAIQKVNNHDIIFVDISLPDINGFEVIKSIRQRTNPNNIPIVALTVYTGKEEKAACLGAGANEFASKPISQTRLKKLLMRYVSQ